MLALELLEYIKGNMEGVGTVSVPFHINQLIEAITELEQFQAELALLQEQLDAVKSDNIRLKSTNETLKEEIVKLKTQMLPNELEQNTIEAMDEGRALKEK